MEQQIENLEIIQVFEWNYKFDNDKFYFQLQNDWNNTLITTINNSGAILFRHINKDYIEGLRTIEKYILSPSKFEYIFKTLIYYENKRLANRFDVSFIENDENSIFLVYKTNTNIYYAVKINILNFI